MEEGLFQEHDKAYEYLEKLGIYELRLYGRKLGVQRPTGLKKKGSDRRDYKNREQSETD